MKCNNAQVGNGQTMTYSTIRKAAGLTAHSCSMTLPGIIPENLCSHEWGRWVERSLRSFQPLAEC